MEKTLLKLSCSNGKINKNKKLICLYVLALIREFVYGVVWD